MAKARVLGTADDRKIAVYVRKSKITETGKSIEVQTEKCISLSKIRYDATDSDILVYCDEGKSGFFADRPMFIQMGRDIRANKIKAVICYKIDRISRQTVDLLNFIDELEKYHVAIISVSDSQFDTSTNSGKLMISMLAAIAEFERNIIAERITDNMYELAKEGRWLGGGCPLGYYSKKEAFQVGGRKTTVNHLEPVETEQKAVIRLYEVFACTLNYKKTAETLNDEGHKTKNGKDFTQIAVKNILKNPVYAVADEEMRAYFAAFDVPIWANDEDFDGVRGVMAFNKTLQYKDKDPKSTIEEPRYRQISEPREISEWVVSVGKHKGIVSGASWVNAQTIMKQIEKIHARPKQSTKPLLSGLVRCSKCGSNMYVKAESGRQNPDGSLRFRYDCSKKRYDKACDGPNVSGYDLDNYVVEQISKMSEKDDPFFRQFMDSKKTLLRKTQETEKELNVLRKRLALIEADIQSQTANLRTAPDNVIQELYSDIGRLNREREEKRARVLEIESEAASHDAQLADLEAARRTILDFSRLLSVMDYEGRLRLIHRIVEAVVVKGDDVHLFLKGTDSESFFVRVRERSDVCRKEEDSICYGSVVDKFF